MNERADPAWEEFGSWLRELRERASFSLEQVDAKSADYGLRVTKSYLSRAELGEYLPDLDRLMTLGAMYGISLPDLADRYETVRARSSTKVHATDKLKDFDRVLERSTVALREGEAIEAHHLAERALRISKRLTRDPIKELNALIALGASLNHLGKPLQVRAIAEELIDRASGNKRIVSAAVHLLVLSFSNRRRYEIAEALVHGFRQALNDGPRKARGKILLSLSNVQRALGRPADAVRSGRKSLDDLRECKEDTSPAEMAQAHYILGLAFSDAGEYNLALDELKHALRLYQMAGTPKKLAMTFIQLGDTYFEAQNFEASRRYLTRGVRLSRECGALDLLLGGYAHLWKLEKRMENEDRAQSHVRMARRLVRRVPRGTPALSGFADLLHAMGISA